MSKKNISCRVCGKQFEPCAFCQKNGDIFRWRNFACSLECAKKYVADAIAYNEKMRNKNIEAIHEVGTEEPDENVNEVVKECIIYEPINVDSLNNKYSTTQNKKMKKKTNEQVM